MTEEQQSAVDFRNAERVNDKYDGPIGQRCGNCDTEIVAADGDNFVTDDDNPQGYYICAECDTPNQFGELCSRCSVPEDYR